MKNLLEFCQKENVTVSIKPKRGGMMLTIINVEERAAVRADFDGNLSDMTEQEINTKVADVLTSYDLKVRPTKVEDHKETEDGKKSK